MISPVFYAALALVAADLSGDLGAVSSAAAAVDSAVNGWNTAQGLAGALVIEQSVSPLKDAVNALKSSSGSVSQSDALAQVDGISALASAVTTLLGDLVKRAGDFEAQHAQSIVTSDIDALSSPTADIIGNLAKAAGDNVPADLAQAAGGIASAFSQAISAYNGKAVQFPNVTAGSGSSSAAASSAAATSAASSAAASSAAASSAAASSAASSAAKTTGAPTGADATSVVEETVTETVCTHETCTEVSAANGAARNAVFGGVAAIAAALL